MTEEDELRKIKYELEHNRLPRNRELYLVQRMGYLYGWLDGIHNSPKLSSDSSKEDKQSGDNL